MPLFMKDRSNLRLTSDGERILAIAEQMDSLGGEILRGATDAARELEGVVRISTMDGFGATYLASRLSGFIEQHPRISVQLVTAPHILNLADREADLSINMMSPEKGRLVVRKLSQFCVGLYASEGYLSQHGLPQSESELEAHTFITYVDELLAVPSVRWLPDVIPNPKSRFACTSLVGQLEATLGGAGLAMLPHFMAYNRAGLVRVLPGKVNLVRDWWLVVHQDLQKVPRIRAAIDYIGGIMGRDSAVLLGDYR